VRKVPPWRWRRSISDLPAPIGRAGFIINPVVDDLMAFTRFAASKPERPIGAGRR